MRRNRLSNEYSCSLLCIDAINGFKSRRLSFDRGPMALFSTLDSGSVKAISPNRSQSFEKRQVVQAGTSISRLAESITRRLVFFKS